MECISGKYQSKVDSLWIEVSWLAHCFDIIINVAPRDSYRSFNFPKIEWFNLK